MIDDYNKLLAALSYKNVKINDDGLLVWDTDDTEPDEQFENRCQLLDDLKDLGWQLLEVESDHNTIQGKLLKIK